MGNNKHWYNKAFSSVKNFSSDFAYGVGLGSDAIRYPIHKARQGIDVIDHAIQHGSKIPILNDTLSLLTDNPLYAEALGLIHSTDKTLEDISKLGYDAQQAIGVSPFYSQQKIHNNFRYDHNFNMPQIAFDSGFVAARQDVARIRGEPQITGATDPSEEFQGPVSGGLTPSDVSHTRGIDQIGGGHIPASDYAQPSNSIVFDTPVSGKISIGYSSEFRGVVNPAPAFTPQVPPNYQQYLLGPTPVQTSPSQSVS